MDLVIGFEAYYSSRQRRPFLCVKLRMCLARIAWIRNKLQTISPTPYYELFSIVMSIALSMTLAIGFEAYYVSMQHRQSKCTIFLPRNSLHCLDM